ncbi:hypothetical protein CYLTODRAFT_425392 [Cylindrobasidium torrendii FP15055 ss-10]|uniref:Uncharacterized protein n=1 Tax=Cylindrobasidium torrendii FP15055 ss-10 TaxID=1314674 RepID=A0A0D7B0T6_9AGAR|nr:hypothetical protein CYLTODRAFT_425392 [Cylindrobasidium torrendii FP15055 ss-10]
MPVSYSPTVGRGGPNAAGIAAAERTRQINAFRRAEGIGRPLFPPTFDESDPPVVLNSEIGNLTYEERAYGGLDNLQVAQVGLYTEWIKGLVDRHRAATKGSAPKGIATSSEFFAPVRVTEAPTSQSDLEILAAIPDTHTDPLVEPEHYVDSATGQRRVVNRFGLVASAKLFDCHQKNLMFIDNQAVVAFYALQDHIPYEYRKHDRHESIVPISPAEVFRRSLVIQDSGTDDRQRIFYVAGLLILRRMAHLTAPQYWDMTMMAALDWCNKNPTWFNEHDALNSVVPHFRTARLLKKSPHALRPGIFSDQPRYIDIAAFGLVYMAAWSPDADPGFVYTASLQVSQSSCIAIHMMTISSPIIRSFSGLASPVQGAVAQFQAIFTAFCIVPFLFLEALERYNLKHPNRAVDYQPDSVNQLDRSFIRPILEVQDMGMEEAAAAIALAGFTYSDLRAASVYGKRRVAKLLERGHDTRLWNHFRWLAIQKAEDYTQLLPGDLGRLEPPPECNTLVVLPPALKERVITHITVGYLKNHGPHDDPFDEEGALLIGEQPFIHHLTEEDFRSEAEHGRVQLPADWVREEFEQSEDGPVARELAFLRDSYDTSLDEELPSPLPDMESVETAADTQHMQEFLAEGEDYGIDYSDMATTPAA